MEKEKNTEQGNKKKKILIIVIVALVVVLVAAGAFASWWLYGPSSTVSLDVNPSVELEINRMGQVTAVKPVGEDATRLLTGYEMLDKDPAFVLGDIVDLFILGGFVSEEGGNALLLTVSSNLPKELVVELDDTIVAYYEYYELESDMYQLESDYASALRQSAGAAGITAGKMAMVEKLEPVGTATREQLAAMSIGELVAFAARNNINTGIYELYEYYLENYLYEDGDFDISFGDWVWEDDSSYDEDASWMWDDSDWVWEDDSDWYWDDSDWMWEDDSDWMWDDSDWDDSDWTDADYDDDTPDGDDPDDTTPDSSSAA